MTRIRFKGQLALSQPLSGHPSECPVRMDARMAACQGCAGAAAVSLVGGKPWTSKLDMCTIWFI